MNHPSSALGSRKKRYGPHQGDLEPWPHQNCIKLLILREVLTQCSGQITWKRRKIRPDAPVHFYTTGTLFRGSVDGVSRDSHHVAHLIFVGFRKGQDTHTRFGCVVVDPESRIRFLCPIQSFHVLLVTRTQSTPRGPPFVNLPRARCIATVHVACRPF
jgi:hypothetical protein